MLSYVNCHNLDTYDAVVCENVRAGLNRVRQNAGVREHFCRGLSRFVKEAGVSRGGVCADLYLVVNVLACEKKFCWPHQAVLCAMREAEGFGVYLIRMLHG